VVTIIRTWLLGEHSHKWRESEREKKEAMGESHLWRSPLTTLHFTLPFLPSTPPSTPLTPPRRTSSLLSPLLFPKETSPPTQRLPIVEEYMYTKTPLPQTLPPTPMDSSTTVVLSLSLSPPAALPPFLPFSSPLLRPPKPPWESERERMI